MPDKKHLWEHPDYGVMILDNPWYRTLAQLQDTFVKSSVNFFSGRGLIYMPLPITTGAVSSPMGLGSDSLPVMVNIKGRNVYLADSMQFLLEYACRWSDKGSFYIMPSFRGEPTDSRHLSQFFHSEAEIIGTLDDVIALIEAYLAFLSCALLENNRSQIIESAGTVEHLEKMASRPVIPRISMQEAQERLSEHPECMDELPCGHRCVNPLGEARLIEEFGGVLWLTHFASDVVPFYQAEDNGIARNADLLMGIGETVGAGERHTTANQLMRSLRSHSVNPKGYDWYISMKQTHPLTTSGFGMGMERFLLWVLKHNDIRDCQIIARMDGATMSP